MKPWFFKPYNQEYVEEKSLNLLTKFEHRIFYIHRKNANETTPLMTQDTSLRITLDVVECLSLLIDLL